MALTKPILTIPYVFTLTGHLTVEITENLGAGSATTFDVSVTGTRYPDDSGLQDFADHLESQLNAALVSNDYSGDFAVLVPVTDPPYRYGVNYDPGGTVRGNPAFRWDSLLFNTEELTSVDMGFTAVEPNPDRVLAVLTLGDYLIAGTYQRSHVWLPEQFWLRYDRDPVRTVRSRVSPFDGSAVVNSYGSYDIRRLVIPLVFAAKIKQVASEDSEHIVNVPGMLVNDRNQTLERWTDTLLAEHVSSSPPTCRLALDKDTPAVFDLLEVVFVDQLDGLNNADEATESPWRFTVDIRGVAI